MSSEVQRKLTTILAADAAGYSREMETDELRALGSLQAARKVFTTSIERHRGRIANTAGDGLIAEFPSVVEAVQCAIEVQRELNGRLGQTDGALRFRIGIHLGDVLVDGNDLLGEGVNLAARLQTMAEPGGILISQQVYDQVHAKLSVGFEYLGGKRPRNYSHDVAVYRISQGSAARRHVEPPRSAGGARSWHRPEPVAPPQRNGLRQRVLQRAKVLAAVWVVLLAIDLATGEGHWAYWPGIAFVFFLLMEAAPLFVRGWFTIEYARAAAVIVGLFLINAATWSGEPWALWPAGAIVAIGFIRRFSPRRG